jgi:hypothetical protein
MKSNGKCNVKIPKSQVELKRPVDKRHVLLRIEKENVWIRGLDRQLAETFCTLITRGDPITVERSSGVIVWGTYAGEHDKTGTIILDQKPDGSFKLVPMDTLPDSLLKEVAQFVGRPGSLTSKEGKRGLVFRGEFRKPNEPVETVTTAQKPESEVAPAGDGASAETVQIPKSQAELKRPVDKRHALLRIEKENAWVRGLDRQLAETFCTLVTQGATVTVERTSGIIVWGKYAGEPDKTGTIILDHKPDGSFKLVALGITPDSLLTQVANFVASPGSVTSEEGKNGLVFRGELRKPETVEQESGAATTAGATTVEFEKITGADAIAAIKQKVTLDIIDLGVKVRIRGNRADCEKTAKHIIKGRPTLASQKGAKYMIEGNISKSFLRKGANEGPDANGVYTRENPLDRTFTAFGENLPAVQAACLKGCKEDTMYTVVINDRSSGYFVISSGRRRLL